jgi:hypothetical protein
LKEQGFRSNTLSASGGISCGGGRAIAAARLWFKALPNVKGKTNRSDDTMDSETGTDGLSAINPLNDIDMA